MTLGLALLAFLFAALEEWVSIRRLRAVLGKRPLVASVWAASLGAILLLGVAFMIQSRWYAVPLLGGYATGAYVAVRFR